jgi:hypothetical protein
MQFLEGLGRIEAPVMQLSPFVAVLILFGLALHALPPRAIERVSVAAARLPSPAMAIGVAIAMLLVEAMRPEGIAPFIYYQF